MVYLKHHLFPGILLGSGDLYGYFKFLDRLHVVVLGGAVVVKVDQA
jgi:hypothetical protein